MLLRIIDQPAANNANGSIDVVLESDSEKIHFSADYYPSPQTANFHNMLSWYFREYPAEQSSDKEMAEKIINIGRYMGDKLLGEDHELIKVKETIEDAGFEQLRVQMESSRIEFFSELWEALILPECPYVLAGVAKSFTRRFNNVKWPDAEIHYGLFYKQPPPGLGMDPSAALGMAPSADDSEQGVALRLLHVVSRPQSVPQSYRASNAFAAYTESLSLGEGFHFELWSVADEEPSAVDDEEPSAVDDKKPSAVDDKKPSAVDDEEPSAVDDEEPSAVDDKEPSAVGDKESAECSDVGKLLERVADAERPVHIFHYDGPVELVDGNPHLVLGEGAQSTLLPVDRLAKQLAENNNGLLVIDANGYSHQQQELSAEHGLACVAYVALANGVANVVGLTHGTDPWTARRCFGALYGCIMKGFSVGQAVIEARKILQAQLEINTFSANAIPFQCWPLLAHYGNQEVYFLEAPQQRVELQESRIYTDIRQRLHGFKNEYLPPALTFVSDNALPRLLNAWPARSALFLCAGAGAGKTCLAHLAAFYLLRERLRYGFYFDCEPYQYSRADVLEMIAPVMARTAGETVEAKLAVAPCLFVFDNIQYPALEREQSEGGSDGEARGFFELLDLLVEQGHCVVLTGTPETYTRFSADFNRLREIPIVATTLLEQQVLAAETLRRRGVQIEVEHKSYIDVLKSFAGNPLLTTKAVPFLEREPAEKMAVEVAAFRESGGDVTARLDEWQWRKIAPVWQRWLLLLADQQGVLLEMLVVACDQNERPQPVVDLFTRLGDAEAKLADGVTTLYKAGYLIAYPHGKVLDLRYSAFLNRKRGEDELFAEQGEALDLLFSKVLCEGVARVMAYTLKQPDQVISYNLLANRGLWAKHLERLWFAGEYAEFMHLSSQVGALLKQHQLAAEMAGWALNLLLKTKVERAERLSRVETERPEPSVALLSLALYALAQPDAATDSVLADLAEVWTGWLQQLTTAQIKENNILFHQCTQFLGQYYSLRESWRILREVSEVAYRGYLENEAWGRAASHISMLIDCCFELGDYQRELQYERELLEKISPESIPASHKLRFMLSIVLRRISKEDFVHARQILDRVRTWEGAAEMDKTMDTIQADIYFKEERLEEATKAYSKLWQSATEETEKADVELVRSRLKALEEKLTPEVFAPIYNEYCEDKALD